MDKTERLYAVVEELRRVGPAGTTSARLARLLEVSTRTIKRDVSALQQAGLPVWAQPGPDGGYVLDASATLPPVNFTPQQAVAVAIALAALPPASPFAVDATAAQGKVWDALGPQSQEAAAALAARVWVMRGDGGLAGGKGVGGERAERAGEGTAGAGSPGGGNARAGTERAESAGEGTAGAEDAGSPGAGAGTETEPTRRQALRAVEQSIARSVVLVIRYRDSGGAPSTRQVEPIILAHTGRAWYLVAWCRSRVAVRWFRLERIERADLTTEPYEPRPVAEAGTPPPGSTPVA